MLDIESRTALLFSCFPLILSAEDAERRDADKAKRETRGWVQSEMLQCVSNYVNECESETVGEEME